MFLSEAYSRISLLTKLKYVGVSIEDLLDIYILMIRSLTEYCSVVFHSSLTVGQATAIEKIQKTCLKVILGENYVSYQAALEMTGLQTLYDRRENRCLNFAIRALKHPRNHQLFPRNGKNFKQIQNQEFFKVNFACTEQYRKSAIPFCQRKINECFRT